MKLLTIPTERLKAAPYNPRVELKPGSPGYRRLERSIDEFTMVQPIVWNERTEHVVSGHQRLAILKNKGVSEVEVAVVDLPLEREKALNITLNNSNVGGDWDATKLVDVVTELDELPDFDATLTGFDPEDIQNLLLAPAPLEDPDDQAGSPANIVEISLELPAEQWEEFHPILDQLISTWNLTVHLQMPEEKLS